MEQQNMNSRIENIETLIITYLSGSATTEEKTLVEDWLSESNENKRKFAELADVWDVSCASRPVATDTDLRFKKLEARLKGKNQIKSVPSQVLKYAAIFIFALVLGGFVTYFMGNSNKQVNQIGENKIIVPNGSKTNMILPDGSEVWLNAGSSITYNDGFTSGKNREIMLEGEAFFKVTKKKEKPFIVKTGDVIVRALGTSFNVKAYTDEPTIEATLVEGSIAVSKTQNGSEKVILKPNQQIIISKDRQLVQEVKTNEKRDELEETSKTEKKKISIQENVNIPKYTSWKDSRWIIDNEELGSLAKKLERRYAVKIIFKKDKHREIRFSGTLMEESLEQVLEVISFASPVSFSVEGTTVIFDSK